MARQEELAERARQQAERQSQALEREKELAARDRQQAERESQALARERELSARDSRLAERERQQTERERDLGDQARQQAGANVPCALAESACVVVRIVSVLPANDWPGCIVDICNRQS